MNIPNNLILGNAYPISKHPNFEIYYNSFVTSKNKLFYALEDNNLEYLSDDLLELIELTKKLERLAYPAIFVEGFKSCKINIVKNK